MIRTEEQTVVQERAEAVMHGDHFSWEMITKRAVM